MIFLIQDSTLQGGCTIRSQTSGHPGTLGVLNDWLFSSDLNGCSLLRVLSDILVAIQREQLSNISCHHSEVNLGLDYCNFLIRDGLLPGGWCRVMEREPRVLHKSPQMLKNKRGK